MIKYICLKPYFDILSEYGFLYFFDSNMVVIMNALILHVWHITFRTIH